MTTERPADSRDYTVHVFADHGWTDLEYVLSDLRNSIVDDHRMEHERSEHRSGVVIPHPHSHPHD
ncbi:MAG TPA: hypothetical protein VIN34_00555 [Candidatus Limnocylindria bacterium]|jgi:hypothetical protein